MGLLVMDSTGGVQCGEMPLALETHNPVPVSVANKRSSRKIKSTPQVQAVAVSSLFCRIQAQQGRVTTSQNEATSGSPLGGWHQGHREGKTTPVLEPQNSVSPSPPKSPQGTKITPKVPLGSQPT